MEERLIRILVSETETLKFSDTLPTELLFYSTFQFSLT